MCNYLHKDFEPIEEEGVGWKIFREDKNEYLPLFSVPRTRYCYFVDKDGWIRWDDPKRGDGFCLFPTKEFAEVALDLWPSKDECVIKKIEYRKGLGKHIEDHFISNRSITICLCKKFRIINE